MSNEGGLRLKELRRELKMTQVQLGETVRGQIMGRVSGELITITERSGAKICPKGAIPSFQYSNIPSFQL